MEEHLQSISLGDLAKLTNSMLVGNPDKLMTGFAELKTAGPCDISFLSNPKYRDTRYVKEMKKSNAGAIFISPTNSLPKEGTFLLNEDPSKAFQQAVEIMRGGLLKQTAFQGVHPTAILHESVKIGKDVTIGPHAVIDGNVVIGDRCFIGAGTYIGYCSTLGEECVIFPNVTIQEYCELGNRVKIYSGTVIGTCGFGFSTDKKGIHTRLSHVGTVVIEDDVEIGANCTVDRARFASTRLGKGTKLDSQVVIGHNTQLGQHNLICGQSAIAGSTSTGNHVILGGQCGVDGHLHLEDGVMVTAKSGVTKSLSQGRYGGNPAQPLTQHNRNQVLLKNIGKYINLIKELSAHEHMEE